MCQIRLRSPVTCVNSRSEDVVNLFYNLGDFKDVIRQPKGIGIEVKVSVRWRVVTGLILGPVNLRMVRRGNTVTRIAQEVVGRRIRPEITVSRFLRAADESR